MLQARSTTVNLIVDVGGVLVILDPGARNRFVIAQQQARHADIITYADIPPRWQVDFRLGLTEEDEYVRQLSKAFGLTTALVRDAERQLISGVNRPLINFLLSIDERCDVSCLSNTNRIHWEVARALLPERLTKRLFLSFELGLQKPSREIFDRVRDHLGASGSDLIFVDDEATHVAGAIAAGWPEAHLYVDVNETAAWIEGRLR